LAELPAAARRAGIAPPALTIVGEVVCLREKLAWFEHLPLFGQTVIITRPAHQSAELAAPLRELGAEVIEAPAIEIRPLEDFAAVDEALRRLKEFDWVVFTSANGVEAFAARCRHLGLDGRALGAARVAAVGPATVKALAGCFISPDVVPEEFTTQALGQAMKSAGELAGKRILLARSDLATQPLRQLLAEAGAEVQDVAFYRTARAAQLPEEALAALGEKRVDWITFTSSSAVDNFLALLAAGAGKAAPGLQGVHLAAIGPVTAETLRRHGLTAAAVADEHTAAGLVEAILRAVRPAGTSDRQDQRE